jgi:hypothetical protein
LLHKNFIQSSLAKFCPVYPIPVFLFLTCPLEELWVLCCCHGVSIHIHLEHVSLSAMIIVLIWRLPTIVCFSVLFLLAIVLSVLLWIMSSDYPFGIFKLFFILLQDKNKMLINVCTGKQFSVLIISDSLLWVHCTQNLPVILEEWAVPVPRVSTIVLLLLQIRW